MRIYVLLTICLILAGCQSSIQSASNKLKYSAYELVGVEKRDLFKKEINNTKESQEKAEESFKDALEKLVTLTKSEHKKPEREYRRLESAYEKADERAKEVKNRIAKVDQIANDLFKEWSEEIKSMSSKNLKKQSEKSLSESRERYKGLHESLKRSERKMDPVLSKMRDHTLFAKHNLNAKALTGLKKEAADIQGDIDVLLGDIQKSIKDADEFIKKLE